MRLAYYNLDDKLVGTLALEKGKVVATGMGLDAEDMLVLDPETGLRLTPADGERWLRAVRTCYRGGGEFRAVIVNGNGAAAKADWDPQEHPRGKTSPASTPGSFAPSQGGEREATPPPKGHAAYHPNPLADADRDGVTDAALVGVPGAAVPKIIPRLPNLASDERAVESAFARAYEKDPGHLVNAYLSQVMLSKEPNTFSTDTAKILSGDYDHNKDHQSEYNAVVHQTANAIAKAAFEQYVERVVANGPEGGRTILVTAGGCASGKGHILSGVAADLVSHVGAVWDTAGEQNSTELSWVLKVARANRCQVVYAYVDADPTSAATLGNWVDRAIQKGRMVDARLYADSYAIGSRNFRAFYNRHRAEADVRFLMYANRGGTPRSVRHFPTHAWDREGVYRSAMRYLNQRSDIPAPVRRGGIINTRLWA